VTKIFGMVTSR